jgi:aminoglycoside phosphotransferase (APT) family kinase protein
MEVTHTGLDIESLRAWLARQDVPLSPYVTVTRLAGGRSNLTYALRGDDGRGVVVRRPPMGHLLATAHDVLREARLMTAVATAGVPVPEVLATCDDDAVLGAPFAVLELVEGVVLRDPPAAHQASADLRASCGDDLVDALVRLHHADVATMGLSDLARPGSYVERQLRRWSKQWEATRLDGLTLLDDVYARLVARVPAQQRVGLVHSDPKLDNCIFRPTGGLAALVDWELSTVGDPLADLALVLAYWAEPTDVRRALQNPPTSVPGFASRAALTERYASRSTIDLEPLPYYLAFSYWKLACIVAGVHHRMAQGALGGDVDVSAYAAQVVRLAELAHDALSSP